jgi:hypothetical protein
MEVSRTGTLESSVEQISTKTLSNPGNLLGSGEYPRATEIIPAEPVSMLPGPQGDDLIRSISAITGLGEDSVKSEVAEMLTLSGQPDQSEDLSKLSLEQLRAAMLVYLETINADMSAGEDSSSSQMTIS